MSSSSIRKNLSRLLEHDRIWNAYAIADLDPVHDESTDWFLHEDSILLRYRGLEPDLIFASGNPTVIEMLVSELPPGNYQYALKEEVLDAVLQRLSIDRSIPMWRMALKSDPPTLVMSDEVRALSFKDLPNIECLMADHEDRPDSFMPAQLESGLFFGVYESEDLISMAGVHVYSEISSVAAVGNVFTHPKQRGEGFGTLASTAVTTRLLARGIRTIVLNVSKENEPAIRSYSKIGFEPHCRYLEGTGHIH
jgi:RimJ/RimL family protein N-acetyltransferase